MAKFPVLGTLVACKCGRMILIEQSLFGVNHVSSTSATCWDCMTPDQRENAVRNYRIDPDSVKSPVKA